VPALAVPQAPSVDPESTGVPTDGVWRDCERRAAIGALRPVLTIHLRGVAHWESYQPGVGLECRDPESTSGDQNRRLVLPMDQARPSVGRSTRFISGKTESVFDFLVRRGGRRRFPRRMQPHRRTSGIPPPSSRPPATVEDNTAPAPAAIRRVGRACPRSRSNNRQLRRIVEDAWGAVNAAQLAALGLHPQLAHRPPRFPRRWDR